MNANLLLLGFLVAAAGWAVWAQLQLSWARDEAEGWRSRHGTLELELARTSAQAKLVGPLETERGDLRERLDHVTAQKSRLETTADRVPSLEQQVAGLMGEITALRSTNAALTAQMREQAQAHQDKLTALTDVKSGIETGLKGLVADVLKTNQGTFLELANQAFEKHKVGAEAELAARETAVANLVSPLAEALQGLREETQQLERNRSEAYGALSGELRSVTEGQLAVRTETSRLVQALRASPKTRGRWGEQTLHNVLELSGLSPYADFSTEETFEGPDGRVRPDVVIRMPGTRYLVVDAKTPITAYLDAVEATTDTERHQHLLRHAAQTRDHVRKLAAKAYWDGLTVTPDYVVMFIPGENFFAAALEHDPGLIDDAARQRVVLATPSTLIALARAVAYGWRQEKVAENAQRVHELGRELYRRMTTMAEHIQGCGGGLSKAVKGFNDFVGSLEHSVMPQVRRFNELEVEGTATVIPAQEPITQDVRLLRSDRDFAGHLGVSANSDTDAEHRPAA
jgi:DNA recombination protein RmuC